MAGQGPGRVASGLRWGSFALLVAGGLVLAGCEAIQPYHTSLEPPKALCNPDAEYGVPEPCQASVLERSEHYDLYFTEFTDQGLQYPSEQYPGAAFQIATTLKGLQETAADPRYSGVSLIVFVHGWKHNARHDDENVRSFRALLQSTAALEAARNTGHRVVGVYVGWRGLSVKGDVLSNVSFWDRKAAALRVAQGSPRELFSRLRSFRCAQNLPAAGPTQRSAGPTTCSDLPAPGGKSPKVRMLMIGHSFGAWILYNAVAGSLIESLTHAEDTGDSNAVNLRYADMIVLLNPAFEASRYTPLHRIATTSSYARYQAPLLVSVTTSADWATRTAFPAGRFLNTQLEVEVGDEEHLATKHTIGHVPKYVTHELTAKAGAAGQPKECATWAPLARITDPRQRQLQAAANMRAEEANTRAFPGVRQMLEPGWTRAFCGGTQLVHRDYDPNSIIWNVHTDESVMMDHNDISNPALVDFVRQLYHDSLLYPRLSLPNVAPSRIAPPAGAK